MNEIDGKHVMVLFRKPLKVGNLHATGVNGTSGGVGTLIPINRITKVWGLEGEDITDASGLKGKTLVVNRRSVNTIVVADD
ncbi:hypothetical protein WMF27_20625 [Sorangium sp. So ce281]|uniref:hypothetical protein n=1 Tax=unclassified Sorangium TaxID=2621164 RepID=UPI003F5E0F23